MIALVFMNNTVLFKVSQRSSRFLSVFQLIRIRISPILIKFIIFLRFRKVTSLILLSVVRSQEIIYSIALSSYLLTNWECAVLRMNPAWGPRQILWMDLFEVQFSVDSRFILDTPLRAAEGHRKRIRDASRVNSASTPDSLQTASTFVGDAHRANAVFILQCTSDDQPQ